MWVPTYWFAIGPQLYIHALVDFMKGRPLSPGCELPAFHFPKEASLADSKYYDVLLLT